MLRIRFHGRGGQGIKTASQILGTAGFLAGYRTQDFPLYGAERRGAPIVASTRIDKEDVLERGSILLPDLILIGDETLIDDPVAAPLSGADAFTGIFINSTHFPEALKEHFKMPSLPAAVDLTEICLRHIERANVLSSGLAAAAARLTGIIDLPTLQEAIRLELSDQGFGEGILQKNLELADDAFNATSPLLLKERPEPLSESAPMADLQQEDVSRGAPLILSQGNMALRKTGNWRVHRPEINYEECNGCWICFARCPDGAMGIGENGLPVIDYEHCKGCLICAEECPKHAISFTREVSSWS